jgi:hypothetical protein
VPRAAVSLAHRFAHTDDAATFFCGQHNVQTFALEAAGFHVINPLRYLTIVNLL